MCAAVNAFFAIKPQLFPERDASYMLIPATVVVAVALLVGLAFGLDAVRDLRLLARGTVTTGRLEELREVRDGRTKYWIYTFSYVPERGLRRTVEITTHAPQARLEDDAEEALIYDPVAPWRATTLDHLPGAPRIDQRGRLRARETAVARYLLAPVALLASYLLVWILC